MINILGMEDNRIAKVSPEVVKSLNNTVCRLSKMDANSLKIWYMLSSYYHLEGTGNRIITLNVDDIYNYLDIADNRKRSVLVNSVCDSISKCGFVQCYEDNEGSPIYKVIPFASYVEYSLKAKIVTIKINEEADIFLRVTQFAKVYLKNIVKLKTTEEIILYTLFQLRKGMNGGVFNIKIDELKLITDCTTPTYLGKTGTHLFLKKVLGVERNGDDVFYTVKPFERKKDSAALPAINALTELEVKCRPIKGYKGKIVTIEFTIIDTDNISPLSFTNTKEPIDVNPIGYNPNHVDSNAGADIDMGRRTDFIKNDIEYQEVSFNRGIDNDYNRPSNNYSYNNNSYSNTIQQPNETLKYNVPIEINGEIYEIPNMIPCASLGKLSSKLGTDSNAIVDLLIKYNYSLNHSYNGYLHKVKHNKSHVIEL